MNEQLSNMAKDIVLPRPEPKRSPWVAVAGSKGGIGKTTLAVNLALLLQKAGYRVLLADLDPGCGDVGVHLRLSSRRDVDDVANGLCDPHDAIVEGPGRLSVLLGKTGSTRLCGDGAAIESTLDELDRVAKDYDIVVADTGAGIGPTTTAVAARADLALAVTTPDAAALTDTYALAKVLHRAGRPLPGLVVNRAKSHDQAARAAQKLAAVTTKFLGEPIRTVAWIADDTMLSLSVTDQRPMALFGHGPALEDLRSLCASVLAAIPDRRRRAPKKRTAPRSRLRPAAR